MPHLKRILVTGVGIVAVWFSASQDQCTPSAHRDSVGGS